MPKESDMKLHIAVFRGLGDDDDCLDLLAAPSDYSWKDWRQSLIDRYELHDAEDTQGCLVIVETRPDQNEVIGTDGARYRITLERIPQ